MIFWELPQNPFLGVFGEIQSTSRDDFDIHFSGGNFVVEVDRLVASLEIWSFNQL